MDNKGQISLEAVLMIGVGVLVIISLFNVWNARMSLAREVGEAGEGKMTGILLAEAINNVYANGENFSIILTDDEINFTRLGESTKMVGGGLDLPIVVDKGARVINISKDMSKTGGNSWTTQVSIVPSSVDRKDATATYPELTIRNNGTHVILYGNSSNIQVS